MRDQYQRTINYLRVSVTDRCNLRCVYCMPEEGIAPVPHPDILAFEEIVQVCRCASKLGISRIKLTGGEPLVRKGISSLVQSLKMQEGIEQVTMTTNGILLGGTAYELKDAGLDAVNISLDTLDSVQFQEITRRPGLEKVLESLETALHAGLRVKVNCVPNQDTLSQVIPIARLAKEYPIDVRFIEIMPIGLGSSFKGVSEAQIRQMLSDQLGMLTPCVDSRGNGPAQYSSIDGFQGKIGFISAISHKFCSGCNRVRLTAEGFLKLCLQYDCGLDLRARIRSGVSEQELIELLRNAILRKPADHRFGTELQEHAEQHNMSQIGG